MEFNLQQIVLVYQDEDDEECQEKFKTATEAVDFITENNDIIKDTDEDVSIYAEYKENRIIHSASLDPLDEDDVEVSFEILKDMAEEEPTPYKPKLKTKNKMKP